MSVGLILLAAGNSSRMGSSKQLLVYHGKTLLHRAAEAGVDSGCSPVIVVLGHDAARMQSELEGFPMLIVINPDWQNGMGSSIRVGIERMEKESSVNAVAVMLCDQPYVDASIIRQLLEVYRKKNGPIVAASYGQTLGVPAIFPRRYFAALGQLPASGGAKQLLMNHPTDVFGVPMDEAALDIDTPDDFQKLK
jgi:molybdenum cofactor cytidylyltransferase